MFRPFVAIIDVILLYFQFIMLHKGKYTQKFIPTSKSSSPLPPFFLATLWGTPADSISRYNCSLQFNVHGSVHRKTILIYIYIYIYISNKMQRYTVYFTWKLVYMFRVVPPPIIRSASNCIYSIWY